MCKTSEVKLYIFWRDIKEDLNERVSVFMDWMGQYCKYINYPKLMCGINGLSVKTKHEFLGGIGKLILKFM